MIKPLTGKRIAVAGGRKFDDLATIIAKQGGEALSRPMMGSVSNDSAELADVIRKVCEGVDWFVLVTGVGTKALLEKADELGLGERLRELLGSAKIAARGYKTFNVLKTLGLEPVIVDDDGTVEGVRRQLESFDFSSKRVAVQLHGERMPGLTDWLLAQGAHVIEIPLYFYEEPQEKDIRQLLFEVISGDVDAVAFTNNMQVKFFFEGARRLNAEMFIQKALNEKVIALSVGSMTSAELGKNGVTRIVAPEHERMGAMVMALAAHYQQGVFQAREDGEKKDKGTRGRGDKETSLSAYPVVLTKLSRVVVVGGGHVAERKIRALLEANIKPTLVSPELTQGLLELKAQNKLRHLEKRYEASDLENAQLVMAATNDMSINEQIATDAASANLLCDVVDNPELGNIHTVGNVRRGDLLLTVSSNGKSPALTRYIKEELERYFPKEYAEVLEVLHHHRDAISKLNENARHQLIANLISQLGSREGLEHKLQALLAVNA